MVNGLVLAGNAAGGFAMPPLFQFLLATYGVRSTLLLIGAVCLHVVLGAALFRPVAMHEQILLNRCRRQLRLRRRYAEREASTPAVRDSAPVENASFVERMSLAEYASLSEKTWSPGSSAVASDLRLPALSAAGHRTRAVSESLWCERRRSSSLRPPAVGLTRRGTVVELRRRDSRGQEATVLVEMPQRLRTSSLMLSTADVTTDATTQLDDQLRKLRDSSEVGGCTPGLLRSVRRLLSLQLLKNRLFVVEVTSVFLMAAGTPYVLLQLPAFGVSRGLSAGQTAEMLSIASALDLVSRLSFGWLLDQNFFGRPYALAASQLLAGVTVLVMPFSYSYGSVLCLCLAFAVGMGTWFINLAPVLADQHGVENIAASYGLARMFHGLSSLVTPPIFGAIVDSSGDYGSQFFAMGSLMTLGGLLILLAMITGMDKKYGEYDTAVQKPAQAKAGKTLDKV